jgi:glycosyltransferase involved in cell wall biosynthesis
LVVGSGRKERELKDWVKMENLTTQIIFLGNIAELSSLFKVLDVSVLPSTLEGLGLSILEAQANGVPVVATSVGGITEIVKDKETGILVEPSNVDDLYRGIKLLLEDVSLREEIVNNAKREIKERFSLERMISKVMQVYEEAIRQRSAG